MLFSSAGTPIEKYISDIFEPYQNTYLNKQKTLNDFNLTTENLAEYFFAIIEYNMEIKGWKLIRLELSESPNRTYIIVHSI